MLTEDLLKAVVNEQKLSFKGKNTIVRKNKISRKSKLITIVTGVRRCGKSTLLKKEFDDVETALYINFEDPRLDSFDLGDFIKIEKIAKEEGKKYFLFDEIQNVPEWEKYIRSAHDGGRLIYISGSNASMLSRELGTRLTGRYLQMELFPFNYVEYLNFKDLKAGSASFKKYMNDGGFPEFLQASNLDYLRTLLRDIIIRDIAVRRNIRNEHQLVRLATHILSNIGKEFSFNNVTKLLSIKSVRSTIDFCDYLKESYLIEMIPRHSYSIKQQILNPKKAYCIDTAMAKANSLSFNEDLGRMLENMVFLHIRRSAKEIFYFKNQNTECDFLVKQNGQVVSAIQSCWNINEDNMKRELEGLKLAMKSTRISKGIIITFDQEDELDGIPLIPAWKWMQNDYLSLPTIR